MFREFPESYLDSVDPKDDQPEEPATEADFGEQSEQVATETAPIEEPNQIESLAQMFERELKKRQGSTANLHLDKIKFSQLDQHEDVAMWFKLREVETGNVDAITPTDLADYAKFVSDNLNPSRQSLLSYIRDKVFVIWMQNDILTLKEDNS